MIPIVVHVLEPQSVCRGLGWPDPSPWRDSVQPEHGTIVTCNVCGHLGVMPDEGHLEDFLPEWFSRAARPAPAPSTAQP